MAVYLLRNMRAKDRKKYRSKRTVIVENTQNIIQIIARKYEGKFKRGMSNTKKINKKSPVCDSLTWWRMLLPTRSDISENPIKENYESFWMIYCK